MANNQSKQEKKATQEVKNESLPKKEGESIILTKDSNISIRLNFTVLIALIGVIITTTATLVSYYNKLTNGLNDITKNFESIHKNFEDYKKESEKVILDLQLNQERLEQKVLNIDTNATK